MARGNGSVGTPMTLHLRRRPKKALTGKKLADHHQAMLRKTLSEGQTHCDST
jgi:hypothetical protein